MDDVREGDTIFHYADRSIRAWSQAQGRALDARRPGELPTELWESNGRLLRADYHVVRPPLGIIQIPHELKKSQGSSGPFDRNGNVKQGYLFPVNRGLGDWFRERFRIPSYEADASITSLAASNANDNSARPPSETERRNQSMLREKHFGSAHEGACSLCGAVSPIEALWMTRIKRELHCSLEDLGNPGNRSLALCVGKCDLLYMLGQIAVVPSGRIIGTSQDVSDETGQYISALEGRSVGVADANSAHYFAWHKENVFRG